MAGSVPFKAQSNVDHPLADRELFNTEACTRIFSFLDDSVDVMSAGLTCKAFVPAVHQTIAAKTALAITQIQEVLKCAAFFNEQILVLTKGRASLVKSELLGLLGFFKFDQKKWEEILTKLRHSTHSLQAAELAEECRLDLIEALAEFNIDSKLLEKDLSGAAIDQDNRMRFKKESSTTLEQLEMDRFILKMNLASASNQESNFAKQLEDILTQAKNTLKGNIKIDPPPSFRGFHQWVRHDYDLLEDVLLQGQYAKTILHDESLILIGPYIWPVDVWNLESESWNGGYGYLRFPCSDTTLIHLDYILKKAGGRIVFESKGQQIILRSINLPEGKEILDLINQALVELPKVAMQYDINKTESQEVEQMLKDYKEKAAKTYKIKL
jgi:hypothetical protein